MRVGDKKLTESSTQPLKQTLLCLVQSRATEHNRFRAPNGQHSAQRRECDMLLRITHPLFEQTLLQPALRPVLRPFPFVRLSPEQAAPADEPYDNDVRVFVVMWAHPPPARALDRFADARRPCFAQRTKLQP